MTAVRSVGNILRRRPVGQASGVEETLAQHIRLNGVAIPVREYRFDPSRRWRSDFAWPEQRLLVECEGAVYSGGRHTRGEGFTRDCEKYNAAAVQGWTVLRFTSAMVRSGAAIRAIQDFLERQTA